MRHLALAILCIGLAVISVYQQVLRLDCFFTALGAFVAFVGAVMPDEAWNMLWRKIKKSLS